MSHYQKLKALKTGFSDDFRTAIYARSMGGAKEYERYISGTPPLILSDSVGKPLVNWSISGNTEQNGTPTPEQPIEVKGVGDKTENLLDVNFTNETIAGISYKLNDDKTITVSGIRLNANAKIIGSFKVKAGERYCVNLDGFTGISLRLYDYDTREVYTTPFTATTDGEVYVTIKGRVDGEEVSGTGHVWANEGSTALPYVPYGYEIPVVDEGDNLLDESTIIKGYYLDNEFTINDVNDTRRRSFSIILNAGTYTLSGENISFIRSIINGVYSTIGGRDTYTFTITERSKFGVSFRDSESSSTIWTDRPIMLNSGSTALPYKPYEQITTPIYLSSPLMTDEQLKSDGTREVKWRKLVLTGDETWYSTSVSDTIYRKNTSLSSEYYAVKGTKIYSTHYVYNSNWSLIGFGATNNILWITDNSNVDELKAFLRQQYNNGTPVTVYYFLTNPTSETIDVPQIPTFRGTNIISIDTEVQPSEMAVTYKSGGKA